MIWSLFILMLATVAGYTLARGWIPGSHAFAVIGVTTGVSLSVHDAGSFKVGFGVAVMVAGMMALCVLLAWLEHKVRLGEAIERALTEESERVAMVQRRRFVTYLRGQADMAESLSKCALFSSRGRGEEAYASAVLAELADQVSDGAADHVEVLS